METFLFWTEWTASLLDRGLVHQVIPNSEDDTLGNDSSLFGNIPHIPRTGIFILGIAIDVTRPTRQHLAVNHRDSNRHVFIYLQWVAPLNAF